MFSSRSWRLNHWRIFDRGVARLDIAQVRVQPVARGAAGGAARDDLDHVAVLQLVGQRHQAAVDLRADAVVADVGVDAEGEVDAAWRRPAGP